MLTIILISLTGLYVYERVVIKWILETDNLNFEPFNCIFCMSFWLGVWLSIYAFKYDLEGELIYLSLPLLYRITQVKLLK